MMTRRRLTILIGILLTMVGYGGGYAACRANGWIVHYMGYGTAQGRRVVLEHRVDVGGRRDPSAWPQSPVPAQFFTPLRWAEEAMWYVVVPRGSTWPSSSRT